MALIEIDEPDRHLPRHGGAHVSTRRRRHLRGRQRARRFGLVGESGSGKSTVLRAIGGLAPDSAAARIADRQAKSLRAPRGTRRSPAVQMVFQDPYGSLHPRQTVDRTLPSRWPSTASASRPAGRTGAGEVGLGPQLPLPLSAPALRRPAPARRHRARADAGAAILLLDEPTSALDVSVQAEILNLLARLGRDAASPTCWSATTSP